MAKLMLPYYENFFKLIESCEITKWGAKTFICKILNEYTATTARKQKVYHGIDILVRRGYLIREKNPKNQRTYLYSETMKSKNYRETIIKRKMEIS